MRVVIAPDSFKGVLDARSVAARMAEGVRAARPNATIIQVPMADGGEGTLDILVDAHRGQRRRLTAHGPLGEPVEAQVGLVDGAATAVVELATVAGHTLVPPERRDPLRTSTFGLGEVLRSAIDSGVDRIILAVGGSATVDGGMGMMQGLGLILFDVEGRRMPDALGGGALSRIGGFQWSVPPDNLENVEIIIAADVLNPACGPHGAAVVFGPQKGADAAAVHLLDAGLAHWADLLERSSGRRIRDEPGTGAAGGVALPLMALLNASLTPGVDLVADRVGLRERITGADLVLTGEGRLDAQSMMGKVVGAVGRMAQGADVPCIAIVGAVGPGADECLSVLDGYRTLDAPLERTDARLREVAAEVAERML